MTSSTLITSLLKTALDSDSFSLDELYMMRDLLGQTIERREEQVKAHETLRMNSSREKFIKDIMEYGKRVNLPMAPEHLRTVGEFLYDSDVLGLSPEQIISVNQPHPAQPDKE
jgi:hypothetical protein